MTDDPFLKEKRLRWIVDEIENVMDDYEFDDIDESLLRAAKFDVNKVRENE